MGKVVLRYSNTAVGNQRPPPKQCPKVLILLICYAPVISFEADPVLAGGVVCAGDVVALLVVLIVLIVLVVLTSTGAPHSVWIGRILRNASGADNR